MAPAASGLGILHIDDTPFVALLGGGADTVQVADPAYEGEPRRGTWLYEELAGRWDGRILVVQRLRRGPGLLISAREGVGLAGDCM